MINENINLQLLQLNTPTSLTPSFFFTKLSKDKNDDLILTLKPGNLKKKVSSVKKGDNFIYFHINPSFDTEDNNLSLLLQDIEEKIVDLLYNKTTEWFENEISIDDIRECLFGFIKFEKGGKELSIKMKLNFDKYDTNTIILNNKKITIDEINELTDFIPIVHISGIKFNSKNFYVILELKDYKLMEEKLELDNENQNNMVKMINLNETENNSIEEKQEEQQQEQVLEQVLEQEEPQEPQEQEEEQQEQEEEAQEEQQEEQQEEAQELQQEEVKEEEQLEEPQEQESEQKQEENQPDKEEQIENNIKDGDEELKVDTEVNDDENINKNELEENENNIDLLENNAIEEIDISLNNLEEKPFLNETKNILKLNENRLLFYKLYILFSEQIKTHQIDTILGKFNDSNINYDKFIDYLNNEEEIYLSEENFSL
tara:strand:+ start:4111 stop:5397 length:1287 start_codon:yes stop_codon:yes gene_type:complete